MSGYWDAYVAMQMLKDDVVKAIDKAFMNRGTVLKLTLEFGEDYTPEFEMETVKPQRKEKK